MKNVVNRVLAVFVTLILIYVIWLGPSAFKTNIESIDGDFGRDLVVRGVDVVDIEDTSSAFLELAPSERCGLEFNRYSEIGESKYDKIDYLVSLTQEINSNEEAKTFDETYSNFLSGKLLGMDLSTFKIIEHDYPIIALLAELKLKQDSGEYNSIPIILYCYGNGTMSEQSKRMFALDN